MPTALFPITIPHEELPGSPAEAGAVGSFTAKRVLRCAWAQRLSLAEQLLGAQKVSVAGKTYTFGQEYPHRVGVYAAAVEIKPHAGSRITADAGDARVAAYSHAELTVRYEPASTTEIARETLETSAEFITLPGQQLFWQAGATEPLRDAEAPGRIVRMQEWVYTLREVEQLPAGWSAYAGHVNAAAVTSSSLAITFPAETLLFHGARPQRSITLAGGKAWQATLRFTYRVDGWNNFFKRGQTTPQPIFKSDGTAYKPYPVADFELLELA